MAFQTNLFLSRQAVLATKHKKEIVFAPLLAHAFEINLTVPDQIDTDQLGTFTGEIERVLSPIEVLRKKCAMAYAISGCDLCFSSEGSFGSHPEMFLIPAQEEWLMMKDFKNNLEIVVRQLSTLTNFNGAFIESEAELKNFALKASFPSHALILSNDEKNKTSIYKGIDNWESLSFHFNELKTRFGNVFVETDMRAMYNPSRMKVIENACEKLIAKMKSLCPQCNRPGFGYTKNVGGLPCELCNTPTRSTLLYISECESCGFNQEHKYPNGKTKEKARFCDNCNP